MDQISSRPQPQPTDLHNRGGAKENTAAKAQLRQVAQGFEGLFLQQMLKSGRAASFQDTLLNSSATETTQALLDQTLAETSAGRAELGLAQAIYDQFAAHLPKDKG